MDALVAHNARSARQGFTLVELLVVMAIIGILAGLITAAVGMAKVAARNAAMKVEITELERALNTYRDTFGEYPPDFATISNSESRGKVLRHLQKAYPRMVIGGSNVTTQWTNLTTLVQAYNNNLNINNLSAANALVFWLGGLPHPNNPKVLLGFSANPSNPFEPIPTVSGTLRVGTRKGPFFEFDPARLITGTQYGNNTWLAYRPNTGGSAGATSPYVYFRATPSTVDAATGIALSYNATLQCWPHSGNLTEISQGASATVRIRPYFQYDNRAASYNWFNHNSFQIICCGQDGYYGGNKTGVAAPSNLPATAIFAPRIPYADNLNEGNYDNLTNFLPGTIESEL